ncbi:hypothetical protein Hypma_002950 [Hypsizygus marmoreus]|uniref:F-box domain-containing protein n=1 Tax=Hypsizygus marmoreus TaxID=39966 RepID=A0A369JAM6_HYPMA|nr:hypothetical protein Hypma_002950 [Hypsizygus marmoreus]
MDEPRALPQEILDRVLDNILSTSSLINCALASRSLLFRSQLHLFSQITIDHPGRCQQLYIIFTENHRLSAYIRKLTLSFRSHRWLDHLNCLTMQATVPPILDMLTSLRSFVFILDMHLEWQDLNQQVSDALFRLFARPSLLSIHLAGIYWLPATFFDVSGTLDRLTLDDVIFQPTSDFDPDFQAGLSFKCLEIIPCSDMAWDPYDVLTSIATRPSSCLSLITDFRISPFECDFEVMLAIFKAAMRSLTTIQLNHRYEPNFDQTHFEVIIRKLGVPQVNLAEFSNLRSLSLVFSVTYRSSDDLQDIISSLCRDLLNFLTTNADAVKCIENLTIVLEHALFIGTTDYSNVPVLLSETRLWRHLDEVVCILHPFSKILVNFVLSVPISTHRQLDDIRKVWRDLMRPQFPILEERGALTLEVERLFLGLPEDERKQDERFLDW